MSILAALIEYNDDGTTRYLGVTDSEYTDTTGVTLRDGLWYPVLNQDVNWSESARHPYQQQGGELTVGDLVLANQSGALDFLLNADIVGMQCTLKRGYESDSWDDMEEIFIARIAGRRFQGYQVLIGLENWLAKLAGPVYTETFGSDTPNPQLVGKQIPYVLGKVTQAPVLEYDPANLTYYTAANASLIGEVTEGGNPTQKWTLEDEPTFGLLGSQTLPITATFEGPGSPRSDILSSIGSFDTWSGGSPDGWTIEAYNPGGLLGTSSATEPSSGGIEIDSYNEILSAHPQYSEVDMNSGSDDDPEDAEQWTINENSGNADDADINISDSDSPSNIASIEITPEDGSVSQINLSISDNASDASIFIRSVLYEFDNGESLKRNVPLSLTSYTDTLSKADYDSIKTGSVSEFVEVSKIIVSFYPGGGDVTFTASLSFNYNSDDSKIYGLRMTPDVTLTVGGYYKYLMEFESQSPPLHVLLGEKSTSNKAVYIDNSQEFTYTLLSGSSNKTGTFKFTGGDFSILASPGAEDNVTQVLTRISIEEQASGNKSYKSLAPTIIEEVGYTSSEYDQTSFDTHADEYGDPELGWLVTGNESADQVLFRLAGSLNGYIWHGLDGKVRSKRLEGPSDPGGTPFVIDSTRADPAEIVAYDDDAPNLRRSVNALRNWKPLDTDDTAGVTTTWTESERAKVTQDWRITRVWEPTTDQDDAFDRRWPMVASREPLSTALRDATTAQLVANEGMDNWIDRPTFYEIPTQVDIGEFADVAVGETVKVELDYPGLEDTWALVLGRSGTATPGKVTLTLWVNGIAPLTLLAENRIDPRIEVTRASTATRWNEQGLLEEVGENVLRVDYDPVTLEFRGWLIEGAATNEMVYSEDLSQSEWIDVRSSSSATSQTAPDGDEDAYKIVEDTSSSTSHYQLREESFVNGQQYAVSVFARADERDEIYFWALSLNSVFTADEVYFDLDSESVSYSGSDWSDGAIEDVGGGWYRCSALVTANATATGRIGFGIALNGSKSYTGDGSSGLHLWGAQIEQGSAPTSYIPTEGSTATRAADDVLIDGTNFSTIWNDSEGTIVAEAAQSADEDSFNTIYAVNDGASNNVIRIFRFNDWDLQRRVSGTTEQFYQSGDSNTTNFQRLAYSFSSSSEGFSANGGATISDSNVAGGVPAVSQWNIGAGKNAAGQTGAYLNGGIRALYYYPKRLTDEQLQEASTVGRDLILEKV
jgi:hypothetical protein